MHKRGVLWTRRGCRGYRHPGVGSYRDDVDVFRLCVLAEKTDVFDRAQVLVGVIPVVVVVCMYV